MLSVSAFGDRVEERELSTSGIRSSIARLRRIATRVGKSGAAMSATKPASKRSRSRSSTDPSALGRRSQVSTSWRPLSYSALKVWKNSSSVFGFVGEELHVVDQQHVDVAVGAFEVVQRTAIRAP